jgi:hypothetical protein
MYNIHSHYETLYNYLRTVVTDPRVLYLYPYGATQPENLEILANNGIFWAGDRGPMFVFYDQEPIYGEYNWKLFEHIEQNYMAPFILITTEKNSEMVEEFQRRFNWPVVYYFHHIFAAHDWFRGHDYDTTLIPPNQRKLEKKFITFNRITGSKRVYRSLFIAELISKNLLQHGYTSYDHVCPEGGTLYDNLQNGVKEGLYDQSIADNALKTIESIPLPLRIDYEDQTFIPSNGFVLGPSYFTQRSFCYVVTETCYWERKCHLTEKIFKPVVSRMPFILVGPAHNLEYFKSYGFKTFDRWWDESYDTIEDPILRIKAVGELLEKICEKSLEELELMLVEMQEILDYNYNLFYSKKFLDDAWTELTENLKIGASNFPPIDPAVEKILLRMSAERSN